MALAPDYKILENSSRYDLQTEVKTWIKLDYVPLGGVSSYEERERFFTKIIFIQAMYHPGNKAKLS